MANNHKEPSESYEIQALRKKGQESVKMYNYKEASVYFDKILRIDPDNIGALVNKASSLSKLKGREFYNLGKYEDAIVWYNKALEIEPDDVDVLRNKALALELGKK